VDFDKGELADITIRDARVVLTTDGTPALIEFEVEGQRFRLPAFSKGAITYDRHRPQHWPPQHGDLWQDAEASRYLAVRYGPDPGDPHGMEGTGTDSRRIVLVPDTCNYHDALNDDHWRPDSIHNDLGPMKLVSRRDEEAR
jgi:hypothetical protein